jgi:hypothetical protein
MRNFIFGATICLSLLLNLPSYSQTLKGESVFNLGAGYSLFSSPSSDAAQTGFSSIPVISATYDYGIVDKFSYGIGLSYQSFNDKYSSTYYNGSNGYTIQNVDQNIYVTNIGLRALYHFGTRELEGYTGIRLGYSFWTSTSNIVNANQNYNGPYEGYPKNVPTFMALIGLRAYISEMVGIHIEVGLGSPYAAETGISFRLGYGTSTAPSPTSQAPAVK